MRIKTGLYTYKNRLQCMEIEPHYDGLFYKISYNCAKTGVFVCYNLMGTLDEELWIKETFDYIGKV
jgi:hypothetical protein